MTDIESQMSKKTGAFGINSHMKKSEISGMVDTENMSTIEK